MLFCFFLNAAVSAHVSLADRVTRFYFLFLLLFWAK